jgi:hypothetical protein
MGHAPFRKEKVARTPFRPRSADVSRPAIVGPQEEQPLIIAQNFTGGNGANGAGVFAAKYAKEREDGIFNHGWARIATDTESELAIHGTGSEP